VNRLGKISRFGRFVFLWAIFWKFGPVIRATVWQKNLRRFFFKNVLGYMMGEFFNLSSGHPASSTGYCCQNFNMWAIET
jgi:hypothetical protein